MKYKQAFKTICLTVLVCTLQGAVIQHRAISQETETVTVEGSAPIISGDRVQARDEALADARVRAIEQVAGVEVKAESVFSHELMVDSSMDNTTTGMIEEEEVLSESAGPDGTFHLKLKARVSPESSRKGLRKLLREDRIALQVSEKHLGEPSEMSILMNQLTRKLNQNGYQQIAQVKPGALRDTQGQPDHYTISDAEELAVKHMSDIVIAGSISSSSSSELSGSLYSAHAEGWVRVFAVKKQRLLNTAYLSGIRGYGKNPEQAGKDALKKISDKLTRKVLEEVAEKSLREISVVFHDIPDFDAFKKYKNLLSLMRWVQDVESSGFSAAKTVFKIKYAEDPEILASRLDQQKGVNIDGFDKQSIEVRVQDF